ncbi:MAG: squalene/phytoene synthase family protein [Verrucomicrobiales bacterium]|nr:squalene/phytoene synthase family protein [Verrucomicrobiales bacterium]
MTTTDLDAQSLHAAEITKKSRSNFAIAFATLPKERRAAMVTYYAFCRVVDDIVDEPGPTRDERLRLLERWRQTVDGSVNDLTSFEQDVVEMQNTYAVPASEMHLLIDGMEKDLDTVRYDTFEDLLGYCYHVASSVGFVCMRIFGCDIPATQAYAKNLGYCLQLTNIVRDVVDDWQKEERIYIPQEDMDRFELDDSLFQNGPEGTRFVEMMQFQYERAETYYEKAGAAIPRLERRRVVATETMRDTYRAILRKMQSDRFRVFEKRYRLGRLHKVGILTRRMLTSLI